MKFEKSEEKYKEIVEIVHKHRQALEEGDPSNHFYWAWIIHKVYDILQKDQCEMAAEDSRGVGHDPAKLQKMYDGWRREIYADMKEYFVVRVPPTLDTIRNNVREMDCREAATWELN